MLSRLGKYHYNSVEIGKFPVCMSLSSSFLSPHSSGLLYKVIHKGNSDIAPTRSDRVKVHYRGTLINGQEFDSSYKRNSPLTFGVTQVIRGWTEALQLMRVGDKFELYIPSDLAYGVRGAGRDIGPNATLIFEVELLEVIGKKPKSEL